MIYKAITKYALTKLEPGFFASVIYYINAKTAGTLLMLYLYHQFVSSEEIWIRIFACYNGRNLYFIYFILELHVFVNVLY